MTKAMTRLELRTGARSQVSAFTEPRLGEVGVFAHILGVQLDQPKLA